MSDGLNIVRVRNMDDFNDVEITEYDMVEYYTWTKRYRRLVVTDQEIHLLNNPRDRERYKEYKRNKMLGINQPIFIVMREDIGFSVRAVQNYSKLFVFVTSSVVGLILFFAAKGGYKTIQWLIQLLSGH